MSILGAEVHLFIYLFILLLQFLERSKETFPLKEMIEHGYRFSEYLSDKILEHSADSIQQYFVTLTFLSIVCDTFDINFTNQN